MNSHQDPREGRGRKEKGVQEAGCLRAEVARGALYSRLDNGLHGCFVLTGPSTPFILCTKDEFHLHAL